MFEMLSQKIDKVKLRENLIIAATVSIAFTVGVIIGNMIW